MKKAPKDPNAEREAQRYDNPIASRECILELLRECGKPTTYDQLCQLLKLEDPDQKEALRRRSQAMVRDGQLVQNRRGGFALIDKLDLIRGRVSAHKDGYGFLLPDDSKQDDLFLHAKQMRLVFHGDVAYARIIGRDRKGRSEGAIVEVLERNTQHVVGRLFSEGGISFVEPDNKRITKDILIPEDKHGDAKPGQIVMVNIIGQPNRRLKPIGEIVEILGEHMAPGMEIDIALRSYDLPHTWPETVLKEVKSFGETVEEGAKEGRQDFRDLPFVTIDGETARDFDDAVFCEPSPKGGWRLIVAIADVSHYVQPGTALDQEAESRGTSVYFPGEVIPMLPEVLSNGLCSLNPNVDRLCLACEMKIDAAGKLTRFHFVEAVFKSHARLTYTDVGDFLTGNASAIEATLHPHIRSLHDLFKVLLVARHQRGAIDFETTDTFIQFDDDRKIKEIKPVYRNDAHRLIEECMLLANVAAAQFLAEHKMPGLYRNHDDPKESKIEALKIFLSDVGLKIGGGEKPSPKDYTQLLASIKDRPDRELIQTVLLRSLNQAVYAPDNIGHFGLAFEGYAHFTSPIRRYPDLLLHRAIRHVLRHKEKDQFDYTHDTMQKLGEHCSMTERRADEATRDVVDWLKCEFVSDKVGETFEGTITGVTGFGLFVTLGDIYVEGLVHVTGLKNDYYHFDAARHQLQGEKTGQRYRLGDTIRVSVARVDLDERQIDFELVTK